MADGAFERRDLYRAATSLFRSHPGPLLDSSETNLYKIRIFLLSVIVDVTGNKQTNLLYKTYRSRVSIDFFCFQIVTGVSIETGLKNHVNVSTFHFFLMLPCVNSQFCYYQLASYINIMKCH